MATVTVSRVEDRLIAVKRVPPERAAAAEREANLLRQLDHPGIVRFVDLVESADGGRALHTLFVSSDTWATRPLTDPTARAAGMASLAAVLADLHALGLAHCRLTAGHVLHGDGDRPVLCSLTHADEATPENRRVDLESLADLVHDDAVVKGPLTGKLSSLADAVRSGQLSARDLASRLDRLLAQRAPRGEPARSDGRRRSLRRAPTGIRVAVGLGIVGMTAGAAALIGKLVWSERQPSTETMASPHGWAQSAPTRRNGIDPQDDATARSDADLADSISAGDERGNAPSRGHTSTTGNDDQQPFAATTTSGTASAPDATGAVTSNGATPDDTSGVGDTVTPRVAPGASASDETIPAAELADAGPPGGRSPIVEHRGRRYAIGVPGDIVLAGDWDCDGVRTPSIVRPGTGAVVLFDAWPDPGATISMPIRWQIAGLSDARVEAQGSCDVLRVRTASGSHLLDPKAAP